MTTASYPFEGYDLAISLEGEQGFAWVRFEDRAVAERVARLLAAGDNPRIQMDLPADVDTGGHAISDVLTADLRLLDDDDVIGHAISVRLPNAQAARDFQMRMLATGALVGTLAVAAVGAQALPSIQIGAPATGVDPAIGLAQQRAGEIAAGGALADPAAGVADFRAGEIGTGSTGLTDYRTGEINAGSSGVADYEASADQRRAGAAAAGGAVADPVADFRAGEINAGSSGLADYRSGEINAGADDQDADSGSQRPLDEFRGR